MRTNQRHAKRLNHFYISCLRKLLKIKWQVLKREGKQSVHTLLKLAQLRWTGHVIRMPEERLPKKNPPWRTRNGQTLPRWSEEAIQRHPQSLPQRFQHTNSHGNKLHMTVQSGEASSEEVLVNMKQRESARPSRNVYSTKPELRDHQQSCFALTSVVPSATDSLELELV